MQLVIDIPNSIYANLSKIVNGSIASKRILDCVKNGTPLPKGHGRLIDADALTIYITMLRDRWNYYGNEYENACFHTYDNAIDEIVDAPTIIPADKEGEE